MSKITLAATLCWRPSFQSTPHAWHLEASIDSLERKKSLHLAPHIQGPGLRRASPGCGARLPTQTGGRQAAVLNFAWSVIQLQTLMFRARNRAVLFVFTSFFGAHFAPNFGGSSMSRCSSWASANRLPARRGSFSCYAPAWRSSGAWLHGPERPRER